MTGDGWAVGADGSRRWGTLGAAGLMLITTAGEVLMQHRAKWTNRGGTWALPGGAIDFGESCADAALRETWEETGVSPESVTVRGEVVTSRVKLTHVLRRQPLAADEMHLVENFRDEVEGIGDPRDPRVRELMSDNRIVHPEHGGHLTFGLGGRFWWEIPDNTVNEWRYTVVLGACESRLHLNPTAESTDLKWQPIDKLEQLELMPEFAQSLPTLRAEAERLGITAWKTYRAAN